MERLYIYDTTLRDGQQTQGLDFSLDDKLRICETLDALGVDYIEGGWPGANPTDSEFFERVPSTRAKMTAFGMTKRAGRSAENDEVLAGVINAGTPSVCLVGKASAFQVQDALGISLDENLENIRASISHITSLGREAIFDAEHFFDGYEYDPQYALQSVLTAYEAGARWVVLCDTNGGVMPAQAYEVIETVQTLGLDGARLGIHAHNDTEQAVAVSLAAIDAGVRQVQGTLNGIGERCGNANLTALIAILNLKSPYQDNFETGISEEGLRGLTTLSRGFDERLNRVPQRTAAFVGSSAFAHKSGLHASAILKNPATYEHIDPHVVGNERVIPMSNQAGQSNLRERLKSAGIEVERDDPRLLQILEEIKQKEDQGYAYDSASASFEIVARRILGVLPRFFEVKRYRVNVERRKNKRNEMVSSSEAVVSLKIGDARYLSVSESRDQNGGDLGPVNALWRALVKDLPPFQEVIDQIYLSDFRVRIYGQGTEAVTRVLIDFRDEEGLSWSTVGVSPNIVDASFEALMDAISWRLIRAKV